MRHQILNIFLSSSLLIAGCGSGQSPTGDTTTTASQTTSPAPIAAPDAGVGPSSGGTSRAAANSKTDLTPVSGVGGGGGGGGARSTATRRASSASREAYLAQTQAAREAGLAKARAREEQAAEEAEKARAEEVVYEGPASNIPRELRSKPGVRVEVRKDRPGEVTVRIPAR